MQWIWLIIFYIASLFLLRLVFGLIAKYLAYGKKSYNKIKKKYKPQNVLDRYFFRYIVKTSSHNKDIIHTLYFFNIINTLVTVLICILIAFHIYQKIESICMITFCLLILLELVALRIISKIKV